ncbi:MAG: alkylated DNA repair dioxygenase AlkB [Myxococcota bacterium]|jgi:alkylated DNA repair dioxygenase AlkB
MSTQLSLLSTGHTDGSLGLADADVRLRPGFYSSRAADGIFLALRREIPWRQDCIRIFGKEHPLPRHQQWFADDGLVYTWSGIRMVPAPWTPTLLDIRRRLQQDTGVYYNTVLANLYRDGHDTVSWHADDEPELGECPLIASLSFGAERDFLLRHRERTDLDRVCVSLSHGSLLLMGGATQRFWEHSLPRRKRVTAPRINLTFRRVREEIRKRDDNLDLSWLRDDSVERAEDLPEPKVVAAEILEHLRVAMEEMGALTEILASDDVAASA